MRWFALLCLFVSAAVGCGDGRHNIVGTWSVSMQGIAGKHTFNGDGTYIMSGTMPNGQRMEERGTYKLDGEALKGTDAHGQNFESRVNWKSDTAFTLESGSGPDIEYKKD